MAQLPLDLHLHPEPTLRLLPPPLLPNKSPPLERSRSKGLERLDSSSFSGGSPVSRAWSLPAAIPAAAQCPAARDLRAAGSASARDLRGSLAAARASLRAEQRARAEAEAAAARVAGVHAAELERLRRELAQAQNRAGRLEMNNKTLVAELEGARSQLPAMEVAYNNLKSSFMALQTRHVALQQASAEKEGRLQSACRAVRKLQARLATAEAAPPAAAAEEQQQQQDAAT